ncbi:MAG: energy-coupling factor ABC transporter permease [Atopobiaceae bacterium]
MHIPENYLSPSTCGVLGAAMVPVWAHAVRTVRQTVPKEKMPLLGVAAAFCFLAMMFNVPVPGGTTGHAVCGTLVAILFGPWAATLCISIALVIQAVFFGDGGILALGANCFNMAFVLPMVGYGMYALVMRAGGLRGRGFSKPDDGALDSAVDSKPSNSAALPTASTSKRELIAAGIGSYLGINAAALCAAIEFGIQPLFFTNAAGQALYCPYPLWVSVPAMLAAHLTVCGAAEVAFTVGILAYVRKVAPGFCLDSVARDAGRGQAVGQSFAQTAMPRRAPLQDDVAAEPDSLAQRKGRAAVAVLLAVLIALVPLGLLASGDAWGEWSTEDVAASVGYTPAGMSGGWEWHSMLPDYSLGALPDWAGYLVSAVVGVALLVIVFRVAAAGMRAKVDFGTR